MSAATLLCLFASFFSFYLITVALCLQFLCKFIGCVGPAGWIAIGASFASSHHWYAVLFGYLLFALAPGISGSYIFWAQRDRFSAYRFSRSLFVLMSA
jgi:hypothetical protein